MKTGHVFYLCSVSPEMQLLCRYAIPVGQCCIHKTYRLLICGTSRTCYAGYRYSYIRPADIPYTNCHLNCSLLADGSVPFKSFLPDTKLFHLGSVAVSNYRSVKNF